MNLKRCCAALLVLSVLLTGACGSTKKAEAIQTNIATAELLVLGLDNGYLSWRDVVNPKNGKHII